jgi:triphosphatase
MVEVAPKTVADLRGHVRRSEPHSQREIEVKLAGDSEALRRLFTLDALNGVTPRRRALKLASTYFDTEDDALDRAGMALRIRRAGARQVLTLKWTPFGEGVFSRGEAEVRTEADTPEPSLLGEELAAKVRDATGGEMLLPRFETRVRRRMGEILMGSTQVAIAADEGEIVAGERRAPISECELELKAGEPSALFALAAQLTKEGLRLGLEPKSSRGYLLARGGKPSEARAIHPKLGSEALAEDAIGAVVDTTLKQFLGNWPALLESDLPESIHQMRVAMRRLRSGLRSFEKAFPGSELERFRSEAKRIATALGAAREHDVFETLVLEGPLSIFPRDESFDALLAASAARRECAYVDARQLLLAPETSSC